MNFLIQDDSPIQISANSILPQPPSTELKSSKTQFTQNKNKMSIFQNRFEKVEKPKGQISFESTFLDEHIEAFLGYFSDQCQQNRREFHMIKKRKLSTENYWQISNQTPTLFSPEDRLNQLNEAQIQRLAHAWQNQPHLLNFIQIILSEIPNSMRIQIIQLSWLIWERLIHINLDNGSDAYQLIQKLSSDIKKNIQGGFKNIRSTLGLNKFNDFLKFFAHTIYLIIEGYFDNPYKPGGFSHSVKQDKSMIMEEEFSSSNMVEQDLIRILGRPKKMPKITSSTIL